MIIGLAGEMASGKGTAAKYIEEKYKASSYRFSTILREILKVLCLEESRKNVQKISTTLRKNFGEDLFSEIMKEQIEKDDNEYIVIDGIRREADIKHLKELPEFIFVYIDANLEKRYGRVIERKENPGDESKTLKEFKKESKAESEKQIKKLIKNSDYIVDNSGTLEELYQKIDNILTEK